MIDISYDSRHRYPKRSPDFKYEKECPRCDEKYSKEDWGWEFGGWNTGKEGTFYSVWYCPYYDYHYETTSIHFNLVVQARVSR